MDRTVRQYVRKLEDALARRAEGPRVFTQRDYRLATRWHQEGVPVGLILEIMERRKVAARGLSQVAVRVEESWRAVCAGRLGDGERQPIPASPEAGPERLLVMAVQGAPPSSRLRRLLQTLLEQHRAGASPDALERILEAELPGAVPPELLQEAENEAKQTLDPHRDRMPPEAFRETVRKGVLARLRRVAGIPQLR